MIIGLVVLGHGCIEEYTHETVIDKTIHLGSYDIYYYGGDGEIGDTSHTFRYTITSTSPVDINIIPSKHEFLKSSKREIYTHYPDLASYNVYQVTDTVTIKEHGGIMVVNNNIESVKMSVKVEYVY